MCCLGQKVWYNPSWVGDRTALKPGYLENDLFLGMDGPHQQVHKGPDRKERQEACQRARRRLGAGR